MGNASLSNCSILFFFFISTILCIARLQITSNSPSLHVGDYKRKLISSTISNVKSQSVPLKEVGYRTVAYGGRKMKSVVGVKKVMAQKAPNDEEDGEKLVRTSSTELHNDVNSQKEDDQDGKQATMADKGSFAYYADYPAPHHHPPKNN